MFLIVDKEILNESMTKMIIKAPDVAKKAKAGQFIILRINEKGERIPLTIADHDKKAGTVTIIYQKVGKTTMLLDTLGIGEYILDFVGPLGNPTPIQGYNNVAVIGGGTGCAIAFPQAKALFNAGAKVDIIAGFRDKSLIILEKEMSSICDELTVMTDNGSNGNKGFVTNALEQKINKGKDYDLVIAIGPLPMMRAVCDITKKYEIKTIISMNPIMIDGTGMCGGCRIKVNGNVKFACVDGPDFDGHQVDFDEAIKRLGAYKTEEKNAMYDLNCNLMRGVENA